MGHRPRWWPTVPDRTFELPVGVPELLHHVGHVLALGDEPRREAAAQRVGAHPVRQPRLASRLKAFVGAVDHPEHDTVAGVVAIALPALASREYEIVAAGEWCQRRASEASTPR